MKKGLIIGLAAAFMLLAFAAGALAYTELDVLVDTQGYTELTEFVRTDFVTDLEYSQFTPEGIGLGSFNLLKHAESVEGVGFPVPGTLTGLTGSGDPAVVMPVFVSIYKEIDGSGGETIFQECAVSGGYKGANGFISEYVKNIDKIHITKTVENKGEWNLKETKYIEGEGETWIHKDIGTWGLMLSGTGHPTDASAFVRLDSVSLFSVDNYYNTGMGGFYFDEVLPTYETALEWCQDRSMNDEIEYFESNIYTNEPFTYEEIAEIDPTWPLNDEETESP